MTKIVTLGGGNGQSNFLDALHRYGRTDWEISSIVSMSDDGRTTGKLMQQFQNQLGLHLPPPGDLRRCLFMMSDHIEKKDIEILFETILHGSEHICDLTLDQLFQKTERKNNIKKLFQEYLDFSLPLEVPIEGYKFGNLLMASLYFNLGKDYDHMIEIMHTALQVKAHIIPVTTQRAMIRAILGNGEVIETQDRISNVAEYSAGIADLQLTECSSESKHHNYVETALLEADYIIITPGDLYTSLISNLIIGGVADVLKKSVAKIIYIGNSTNKGGETNGLCHLDCVNKIEMFLGRRMDIAVFNNYKPQLSDEQKKDLQEHISVKGGDYLLLSDRERSELQRRKIQIFEAPLLDETSLYKHDKKRLIEVVGEIIL
ncbi:2-phospho-L-lactate transferase CofD family protein [Candidatus Gracilibacteria bacterium]|nr:2-phospho-L-lactate transferase CofD family protein [Candidatus Gracilibacteria bacterium]